MVPAPFLWGREETVFWALFNFFVVLPCVISGLIMAVLAAAALIKVFRTRKQF